MSYTLAEAAQATGLNPGTILRAIKSGRISGTRDSEFEYAAGEYWDKAMIDSELPKVEAANAAVQGQVAGVTPHGAGVSD